MSQLLWRAALIPTSEPVMTAEFDIFEPALRVPNTQAIARSENDFPEIPDRKALRLMSRSSMLLSTVLMQGKSVIDDLVKEDSFKVAVYCAIENGSESYSCVKGLLDGDREAFAEKYRRLRSPKQYLKQLPNLAPAQAGIFLNLLGPLNVFHHSRWGGLQALEQMEADFTAGRVNAGIVCTANSFEDPLLTLRNRMDAGQDKILREGAGALVFTAGGKRIDWREKVETNSPFDYGISTQIIELSQKGI